MDDLKQKIISKAGELFERNGCKRITMDQIASALHISKRTLYEHYACKEDLISDFFESTIQQIHNIIIDEGLQTSNPLLHVTLVVEVFSCCFRRFSMVIDDIYTYYPNIFKKRLSKQIDKITERIERLAEGQKQGYIREDLDIHCVAFVMTHFAEGVHHISSLLPEQKEHMINEFTTTYTRGMLTKRAMDEYEQEYASYREKLNNAKKKLMRLPEYKNSMLNSTK